MVERLAKTGGICLAYFKAAARRLAPVELEIENWRQQLCPPCYVGGAARRPHNAYESKLVEMCGPQHIEKLENKKTVIHA